MTITKSEKTVYEDNYGLARCGECEAELFCDESGDMPDICPKCGMELNYSDYSQQ